MIQWSTYRSHYNRSLWKLQSSQFSTTWLHPHEGLTLESMDMPERYAKHGSTHDLRCWHIHRESASNYRLSNFSLLLPFEKSQIHILWTVQNHFYKYSSHTLFPIALKIKSLQQYIGRKESAEGLIWGVVRNVLNVQFSIGFVNGV